MKWLKDSLYGDIAIDELTEALLDTPEMQRLRRLFQIPFANLVYPGANHTRFEHSLGVMHLTREYCRTSGLEETEKETCKILEIYALLHDIGHTALPHVLESEIIEHLGMNHEEAGIEIIRSSRISDILGEFGFSVSDIAKVLDRPEGQIITGNLGTDRIDYLARDSHYTGVAYGIIDKDRIMRKQKIKMNKLVLDISGLSAAEYLLIARFMMFASVYNHKTKAVASLMMKKAVDACIDEGSIKPRDLLVLDDWTLPFEMVNRTQNKEVKELVQNVMNRNLFKRVFQKRLKDFKNWLFLGGISEKQIRTIEKEIAEDSGVSDLDVIVYIPSPWFKKFSIPVWYKGDIYEIREVSLISRILTEAQWDYMDVYVFAKKEERDKIELNAKRVMSAIEEERL